MRKTIAFIIAATMFVGLAQAGFNPHGKLIERFKAKQQNEIDDLINIKIGNDIRSFKIFNAPKTGIRPAIIMLHGGGGNADNAQMMTGLNEKAKKEGFMVIYPNGSGNNGHSLLTWNATHCCAYAMENQIDDIAFFDQLITKITNEYGADSKRIYISGMSNGAMMTHKIAQALPHKITAIATIVGAMFGDEIAAKNGVPALIINGKQDEMIPFLGGKGKNISFAWDEQPMMPADYQAKFWAEANNCSTYPKTTYKNKLEINEYVCSGTIKVKQLVVEDGTHGWYGGNAGRAGKEKPTNTINATDEIWNFFKNFTK